MASIIIGSIPAQGHVTPMLAVARNFVERGDHVRFITGARFADRVRATGASHIPLPADADYDETLFDTLPERAKLKGTRAVAFDVEHIFVRPAKSQYEAVMAAHASRPADAVLIDPAFSSGAMLIGHRRPDRPAIVVCGVVPLPIPSADTAPFGMGLPPAKWANRPRNAALAVLHRRILRQANMVGGEIYRQLHGAELPHSLLEWYSHVDAFVQFTVPAFEYPRSDAPKTLHFAGALCPAGSDVDLPDWWSDLDGTRPVVHVTQGTVANVDYRQVIAPTLQALAGEDVLVVVSTGGRPLDMLPPLPENARAATFLPYDELLPRTDVYVTNGGYGGVQYALRHGVPIVATGGKEDKPEVGARVAWSGVGRRLRTERPTPRALRRSILAVLEQPRYREASGRIAAEMAAAPGFACLTDVVDKLIRRQPGPSRLAGPIGPGRPNPAASSPRVPEKR
ncbi:glycosyl transferase [Mycobacterium paragordonae]|uniref:Glycosyl transferase n=1 Tax=Mycobacterium paragordonae TaxID=1389713 RepID=A0ABQ1C6R7_9MYCO|nr:nucleotide disphospho-sugar-binding domain-containing protein [Mycobacterium paragordonae]AYE96640.1 glycosyl transferase [Mycobacterium paragordonae]GFG80141.1 glycosyl transferase [Mycobacterium paragordonae]